MKVSFSSATTLRTFIGLKQLGARVKANTIADCMMYETTSLAKSSFVLMTAT